MQKHDPTLIDIETADLSDLSDLSKLGGLYSASQVRAIDSMIINEYGVSGLKLMRMASEASFLAIQQSWPTVRRVSVYCGSGNNAADGYILAGLLAQRGFEVRVVTVGDAAKLSKDGQSAHQFCSTSGTTMCGAGQLGSESTGQWTADLVVDALLGTGFHGELREEYSQAIDEINAGKAEVLALDVPSGLSADTGHATGAVVMAQVTVTFIALKRGLFTAKGKDCSGNLMLAPLVDHSALPNAQLESNAVKLLALNTLRSALPIRQKNAHKYDFGHVVVIGGDVGMSGAPVMTALAAMRSGAGLVTVVTHPKHAGEIGAQYPELMVRGIDAAELHVLHGLLERAGVIALGPGLGQSDWSRAMFAAAIESQCSMVVDADGLNHLAQHPQKRNNWVLTPHPGEATRLLNSSGVQRDRFASASELQAKYGGVAVLKGAGTIIAKSADELAGKAEQGAGSDSQALLSLCPYGNPGMSTAGMGDVLCGVIAGLFAQTGDQDLSAELGVAVHSAAADVCVAEEGTRGLLATDLIPKVRRLIMAFSWLAENEADTQRLAGTLGDILAARGVIYLQGELGAGKTTFSRGILRAYGYEGAVKSPTFTLVEPYDLQWGQVYHFDLYRIADPEELEFLGIDDYLSGGHLCLIEWWQKGEGFLPSADLLIEINIQGLQRRFNIEPKSELGEAIVFQLSERLK